MFCGKNKLCPKKDKECLYYENGYCRAYRNGQFWLLNLNGCLKLIEK